MLAQVMALTYARKNAILGIQTNEGDFRRAFVAKADKAQSMAAADRADSAEQACDPSSLHSAARLTEPWHRSSCSQINAHPDRHHQSVLHM